MLRLVLATLVMSVPAAAEDLRMPPYFWGFPLNEMTRENDARFIRDIVATFGGRIEGAEEMIRLGWSALEANDPETAVRRFNQSYLLDPLNFGAHFGLVLAVHLRGDDDSDVQLLYRIAERAMPEADHVILHVNYSRILAERGMAADGRALIEAELANTSESDREAYLKALAVVCRFQKDVDCVGRVAKELAQ